MRKAWLGLLLCLAVVDAAGAELRVLVTDQHGKPVADAVVGVLPPPGTPLPPSPVPKLHTVNQVDLTFVPYIEVMRPGDQVVFHNSDRTRHHVYSFSAVKSFEFMLSPGEKSAALTVDRPGVVAVGCNIHDSMIAFLYVSEAPWLLRTGKDGTAVLRGLPAGDYSVQAWQPRLRPGRAREEVDDVVLAEGQPRQVAFKLALLPDTRRQPDIERARY